jgi:hypothetical protein
MRDLLLIILALQCGAFVLEGCPAPMATDAPPCIHESPNKCRYADPLSLERWEDLVAFEGNP